MTDTQDRALRFLRCPTCGGSLARGDKTITCELSHRFDIARHGYVNLSPSTATAGGDSPTMVEHRERFLAGGHFAPIAEGIASAVLGATSSTGVGCIAEVGAGTGYYLAHLMDALPTAVGVALDASTAALRRCARAHPRIAAVGCDVWKSLPLADGSVDVVLDVFSPRNPTEFHRVLSPDGILVIVTPTARHQGELTSALPLLSVDPDKESRMEESLAAHFTQVGADLREYRLSLSHGELADLIGMGPSARHITDEQIATLIAALPQPLTVTSSVRIGVYRPRAGTAPESDIPGQYL